MIRNLNVKTEVANMNTIFPNKECARVREPRGSRRHRDPPPSCPPFVHPIWAEGNVSLTMPNCKQCHPMPCYITTCLAYLQPLHPLQPLRVCKPHMVPCFPSPKSKCFDFQHDLPKLICRSLSKLYKILFSFVH